MLTNLKLLATLTDSITQEENFFSFFGDSNIVKLGQYDVTCAQDFRMYLSTDHACLFVKIDNDNRILINECNGRVSMSLFGERYCSYNMQTFSDRYHSPLIYLSLFIMHMYHLNYHDLMRYLLYVNPQKPFNTHEVFSQNYVFNKPKTSSRACLERCYRLYKDYLNDGDCLFNLELVNLKPWELYSDADIAKYDAVAKIARNHMNKMKKVVEKGSVSDLGEDEYYEYERYILFQQAIIYDRLDMAAFLCGTYDYELENLKTLCNDFKENSVTLFVKTLH